MRLGVLTYFVSLCLLAVVSQDDTVITLGMWLFVMPGLAFALMPALLAYSLASLGLIFCAWQIRTTPWLTALAIAPAMLLAVLPHEIGQSAFEYFAQRAASNDFSKPIGGLARIIALEGFGPDDACRGECRDLLFAGASEVWVGVRQQTKRFRVDRHDRCPEIRRAGETKAHVLESESACIVDAGISDAMPDVVIVRRRLGIDKAIANEKTNRWRTWTVASIIQFDVHERQGERLRQVEQRTRVEGRVAGWPFLTLPTIGGGGALDFFTAVNRNPAITNDTGVMQIVKRRYRLPASNAPGPG